MTDNTNTTKASSFKWGGIVSGKTRSDYENSLVRVDPSEEYNIGDIIHPHRRELCGECLDYKVRKKIIHEVKNYFVDEGDSRWNGRTCPDCQKTNMIAYKKGERELKKLSVIEEMKKEIADLKEELKEFRR